MKTKQFYFIAIFMLCLFCSKKSVEPIPVDDRDILEKLSDLETIEVTEISPQNEYDRQFEIDIIQPVDHTNPTGPFFKQRMYLSHVDETAPMVLSTSGYSVSARHRAELAEILEANLLAVTHRYMGESVPHPIDWQYLNIEQSAGDHHSITTLFRQIYTGPWINWGGSKSGQTALFHRRFHPGDVDVTMVMSAPILFSTTDPRLENYIKNEAGNESCRDKLIQFQRTILKNRQEILPLLESHLANLGYGYSLGEDIILEYLVLEFPFYFWSFGSGDCYTLPDSTASASEQLSQLLNIVNVVEYTDVGHQYYMPVYYQLYTEIGYYRLITEHLQDVLIALPQNPSHKIFAPNSNTISFNPAMMQDINTWLQTAGNNIIYVYGEQDSWTAAAVELTGQTNAIKIVQPQANHFLTISDLDEKQLVYEALENWLGLELNKRGPFYHANPVVYNDFYDLFIIPEKMKNMLQIFRK